MFRNSENTKKIEYTFYTPHEELNQNPGNNNPQKKSNIRFFIDTTNEINPNDWYKAYFEIYFKINKLADGTNFTNAANSKGTLAGSAYSLINKIDVNFNGSNVISLTDINHCVNALNMLQFSDSYVNKAGSQSFIYPRIKSNNKPEETDEEFIKKSGFTNNGQIVQSNILLNRYPFFESFKDNLCPMGKMEIIVNIEKDDVLMWIQQDGNIAANKGRVIITDLILCVPKLELTNLGRKNYFDKVVNIERWKFNKISYDFQIDTNVTKGIFKITNAITKPRYVILWVLRSVKFTGDKEQNYNPFTYNNYNLGGDNGNITCTSAQLIVDNNEYYPIQPLNPNYQLTRMYKRAFDFTFNGNLLTSPFIDMQQYKDFYPLFVFDLTKQENLDADSKIEFSYTLSGDVGADRYSWRSLIISKGEIVVNNIKGRATITTN